MASGAGAGTRVAPLRVLLIGPVPRIYGGISAVVGALLDSDLSASHRLIYLAEGTRQGRWAKLRRFSTALLRASWLLLTGQVDLLHLHVGDGGSFYRHLLYLALGRLAGVPVIFHWHLPGDVRAATEFYRSGGSWRRGLVRWALASAQRVVVLSPSWLPALAEIAGPRVRGTVVALPNPVDCSAIHPPPSGRDTSPGPVLFLGDFSPRKGVRDLLQAVPLVLATRPQAHFVLCGGEPPPDVQLLASRMGSAVSFPGFVRGSDKLQLLQQASMLVLPSYAEGLPIAVLEGMAAGLPIVTTPVGGLADILLDGHNGWLVAPGDVPALAQAIGSLLADPALRQQMGQLNRRQALADFDLPIYAERLSTLYREVAGEAVNGRMSE